VIGALAIAIMLSVVFMSRASETVPKMIAGCTLYVGTGMALLVAGVSYWQRCDRRGTLGLAIAILLPVVLFSIFGLA